MKLRHALAAGWVVLVAALSLLPGETVPAPKIVGIDRVAHFAFYAVMALAFHNALRPSAKGAVRPSNGAVRRPSVRCGLAVTAACGAMGGALEVAQAFIPGRTAELTDAALNLAGAAAASALYVRLAARGRRES